MGDPRDDLDFVTIKIWKRSHKLLKVLAALHDQTAVAWLDTMLRQAAAAELPQLLRLVPEEVPESQPPEEAAPAKRRR
jgi:hypothetical protein